MKTRNIVKCPIYGAFSADLLMCVTKYKVCDTLGCYII
jgi:hypothetical protein